MIQEYTVPSRLGGAAGLNHLAAVARANPDTQAHSVVTHHELVDIDSFSTFYDLITRCRGSAASGREIKTFSLGSQLPVNSDVTICLTKDSSAHKPRPSQVKALATRVSASQCVYLTGGQGLMTYHAGWFPIEP